MSDARRDLTPLEYAYYLLAQEETRPANIITVHRLAERLKEFGEQLKEHADLHPTREAWEAVIAVQTAAGRLLDAFEYLRRDTARQPSCHLPRWIRADGKCEHPDHDTEGSK